MADHHPTRRATRFRPSSRISPAMLVGDNFTSSAKGACGRQARHDSLGIIDVTMASGCQSIRRRSIDCVQQQAGQRICRCQCCAAMAAPIVGENSSGARWAWRSFHSVTSRSASALTRRMAAVCLSASRRRSSSILRRLKP